MKLIVAKFGSSGEKIIKLENKDGCRLEVSNYGARVIRWLVPNPLKQLHNIVLGSERLVDYFGEAAYFGATIGPVAGRITQGKYEDQGKTYYLNQNEGRNTLHGGRESFESQIWHSQIVDKPGEISVVFTYERPAGMNGFPGNLKAKVIHTLTAKNEWRITYYAKTDQRTIYNPTNHVYFNLNGKRSSIANHRLYLDSDYFLPLNREYLPTGEIRPVLGTAFDFKKNPQGSFLSQGLMSQGHQNQLVQGIDHPFILNQQQKYQGMLSAASSGITLGMATTAPAVVVYTTNLGDSQLRISPGKILKHQGVTLETQILPDAMNQQNFGSMMLEPEELFFSQTSYYII